MPLGIKSFTSVQNVIQNRTFKVSANKVWKELHDELGIGELSPKHLTLSPKDHDVLRNWFKLESGTDPLNTNIHGDRLDVANVTRDEKWSSEAVFSGMVKVNAATGVIPLKQGDAVTPAGTLLEVNSSDLDMERIKRVVMVENGIIARHWHRSCFPSDLSDAVMIYRGNGSNETKTVRKWIEHLPPTIMKIGYLDFDPAGIGIAIDYKMDAILIPASLSDPLLDGFNNKPECYETQMSARPRLGEQLPDSLKETWAWMTAENRKCAVTQERLSVLKWPLRVLLLK